MTDFRTVSADSPLREAIELVLMGAQQDFPVVGTTADEIVGVLTRDQLVAALNSRGPSGLVRDTMTTDFDTADTREMLDSVFLRLPASSSPVLPVFHDGRLVGLLTSENVAEYMMIRGALKSTRRFSVGDVPCAVETERRLGSRLRNHFRRLAEPELRVARSERRHQLRHVLAAVHAPKALGGFQHPGRDPA